MISARGLVRTFSTGRGKAKSDVRAVDEVDLDVADGEVVAFLGPNGAGKTTTLRILTTLLRPDAGTATVAGHDVVTDAAAVRRVIGYVSQTGGAFSQARAGDEVVDHAMLYGMSRAEATRRGQELFAQLDLDGLWTRTPKAMSGGQRRRLDIVMGLTHQPRLMFLDEPTTGLDPQARSNLWTHIARLRAEQGTTIFLTTHYLDEADHLADRIVIIDHGRIVASDTADNLKSQVAGDLIEVEVAEAGEVASAVRRFAALSSQEPSVQDRRVSVRVERAAPVLPAILRGLQDDGTELVSIEVHRPTLDDVFLNLTGRSLREEGA